MVLDTRMPNCFPGEKFAKKNRTKTVRSFIVWLLNGAVDRRSSRLLSAGRQVSLLAALLLRGLTLAADPASAPINRLQK